MIHIKSKCGESCLFTIVGYGFFHLLEDAANLGLSFTDKNNSQENLLHLVACAFADAIKFKKLNENTLSNMIDYLVSKGVNASKPSDRGITPLHYMAEYGSLSGARALIKHGTSVHAAAR